MMFFKLVIFVSANLLHLSYANEVLDCRYNEWQCGNECIRDFWSCNGTCPQWDWKCSHDLGYDNIADCLHYGNICDGRVNCLDGSDETDCPNNCPIPVRNTLDSYFGTKNGMVSCKGQKSCAGDPCEEKCLSKGERFCNGKCIKKREPCDKECEKDGAYPILCQEEKLCKAENEPCFGKCLNSSIPILYYDSRSLGAYCVSDEFKCIPEGSIGDRAHYMCNGRCIPAFIPCNNTCLDSVLWRTNRRENLFGPIACKDFDLNIERSSGLNKTLVKQIFGNDGYCLSGSQKCNDTCIIDPKRPLLKGSNRRGEECVEACNRVREWPCNGTCIDNDEVCQDVHKPSKIKCEYDQWQCDNKCISKYESCNGTCFSIPSRDIYDYKCVDQQKCVPLYKINDGLNDCTDGSDENIPILNFSDDKDISKINDVLNDCKDGSDENIAIFNFSDNKDISELIWFCDDKIINASDSCHGQCNSNGWKLCLGNNGSHSCIPNDDWCPGEGSCGFLMNWCESSTLKGKCSQINLNPGEEFECQRYDWNMTVISGKGKKCKYFKRWICNGEVVCAEEPCISEERSKSCPKDFYLCGSQCKPDFVACNKTCHKNGFYCEKEMENITVPIGSCTRESSFCENFTKNTFNALRDKRIVNLHDLEMHDMDFYEFSIYMIYITFICSPVTNNLIGEKCCLPMNYRCDGTIECYNGEKSDEDDCNGCRVGLGMCEDKAICLANKCGNSCLYNLKECGYGGAGAECAPSYGGFSKSESSRVDCMDWTRRQVGLPEIFASCTDYGCFPAQLLSSCFGYPRPKQSLAGPCDND